MLKNTSIQKRLQTRQLKIEPVSGGDINEAYRIDSSKGRYFLKSNTDSGAILNFEAEKRGLKLLKETGGIQTPEVLDIWREKDRSFLMLEWIETCRPNRKFWLDFGEQLAGLHQKTADTFGLDHANYIGSLDQLNSPKKDWMTFYYENRIEPQLKIALDSGLMPSTSIKWNEKMFSLLEPDIPTEKPSLLHGDLWGGNLLFNQDGLAIFIDPAVCYGNREMDIAMTQLFGGFNPIFFEAYNEAFLLQHNWEDRLKFYQLYYILVHVNLFGGHYTGLAIDILKYYSQSRH